MNYLELCAKTQLKADVPGAVISSVVLQIGILSRIVGWVEDAWSDIQGSQDWWLFMLARSELGLIAGTREYFVSALLPADFDYFWEKSLYLKLAGVKLNQILVISWEDYSKTYLHETQKTAQPSLLAISPDGKIWFDSLPDQAYTVSFDYQRTPQTLAANLDVPTLPPQFHDVIWRKALVSYGEHYGAPEVYQPASLYLEDRMQSLETRYLPKVTFRDNAYALG